MLISNDATVRGVSKKSFIFLLTYINNFVILMEQLVRKV